MFIRVPEVQPNKWELGRAGGGKYYWGAFVICIMWIGFLALWMVAWADRLGCMLGTMAIGHEDFHRWGSFKAAAP